MKRLTKKEQDAFAEDCRRRSREARERLEQMMRERREAGGAPRPTTEITPEIEERLRKAYEGRPMD